MIIYILIVLSIIILISTEIYMFCNKTNSKNCKKRIEEDEKEIIIQN